MESPTAYILLALSGIVVAMLAMAAARKRRKSQIGLFRFHDGKRVRAVDPISVLITLEEHPKFRLDQDPRRALEENDLEALSVMCSAVREAFDVPAFTKPGRPGLTARECVELLAAFVYYIDLQKKSIELPPTSPQSTASTSAESSEPTTGSTSASG